MALNVSKWSARSKLAAVIDQNVQQIKVKYGEGLRFRVPDPDHFYATIRSHGKFEHVRVLDVDGDTLHVVRGVDGTEPQQWPVDACIEVEWNPAQLCEFAKQCVLGTTPTSVDPGVYCFDCTTCITVGEDGRITDIDRAKSC